MVSKTLKESRKVEIKNMFYFYMLWTLHFKWKEWDINGKNYW